MFYIYFIKPKTNHLGEEKNNKMKSFIINYT